MATTNITTSALIEQDLACIWHPFTQRGTARNPIPIAKGKGLYLYGEDGTRYMDGISSWWVNLHGHAHPHIVEAIKRQAETLEHVLFADFTHSPAIELAVKLLKIVPGNLSKVFFSDNGSTAVEVAIKMALQYWHNMNLPKTKVVCFKKSYHGDTFGAMSAAGKNELNKPFWSHLFAVEQIDPPIKGSEQHSLTQLQKIIDSGDIACFIFEPLILGSGGMITYSADSINPLLQLCKANDVLIIADEVMTGFGRTDTLFASERITIKPDLVCLSKGLTGGFLPLGATVCSQFIFDAFVGSQMQQAFLHGHSYTGNPLACASALASLELLEHDFCEQQRSMITKCHQEFCVSWNKHPKLKRCESLGTILILEYATEKSSSYFLPIRERLYSHFLSRGILLRPLGNVLYVMPPYCITSDELATIYNYIIETL